MNTGSRILKLALLADVSQFGRGMDKAAKQTKTFGQRMDGIANGISKGMGLAASAIAGAAAKLAVDGVKAAIADQKAQVSLAKTLENTTGATKKQVKSVETYIDKLQRATGVSDDKLRPSLAKLVTATGSVTKAQKLQALALNISAGTGKDVETVSLALAKAYNGNLGSLTKLGVKLDDTTIKNKDFDAAAKELNKTFEGQSAAAAETMQGKMDRLTVAFDEAKESIGVALMPTLEKLVKYLSSKEGQKVVTEFAEGFANAMVTLAEVLPSIFEGLKKVGKLAGGLGISWDSFADPKLVAAAAAFGMAPGGMKGKVIAALIAYQATGVVEKMPGEGASANDWFSFGARSGNQALTPMGFITDPLLSKADEMGWTARGRDQAAQRQQQQLIVNISTLDPAAAARAVLAAQAKAKRMGVSKLTGAAG